MKATVVGATVPAKTLRAACAKAEVSCKDVRVVGPRAWVELPQELVSLGRDAMLARLADALATGMMVIDVELPAGARGDSVSASRATYRGVEEDVSVEARELLRGWLAGKRGDDAGAAREIAWGLVGDADGTPAPAEPNAEEQWAQAIVDKLVADGSLELRGGQRPPVARVALILQSPGRDLGERLLAELIDSPAIDEVFADADQLAATARATRPKR
jgi:hypothetical protein